MADNTVINTGTGGDTIASDDVGGVKYQRVKVAHGADGSATDVSIASPLPVRSTAATATLANVGSSTSSVQLLASNTGRLGAVICNDSTSILYVKFGTAASATSYTYKVAAAGTLELPLSLYTGVIHGIWVAVNGNARVTELT